MASLQSMQADVIDTVVDAMACVYERGEQLGRLDGLAEGRKAVLQDCAEACSCPLNGKENH
jgi:hypothetical protein